MLRKRSSVLIVLGLILAAGFGLYGVGRVTGAPQNAPAQPAKPQFREGLVGVDFTGLDQAAKDRALDIMNSESCGCPCGMKIAECRVKDSSCPVSPGMAKSVVDGVKAGRPTAEIVASLKAAAAQRAAAGAPSAQPAAPPPPATAVSISLEGAHVKGNPKAPVTLVEYADFQCPYCTRALPVINQLLTKYPNDLKYVYKHLPLVSIHKFAEPAARASVAADKQGKFWPMYDVLFANQRALDDASLKKYASDLGLDMARFEKDMADPATAAAVNKDAEEAGRIGVGGTPTFFLNGYKVPNWSDVATMEKMIETAKAGGDVGAIVNDINSKIAQMQQQQREAQARQQAEEATKVYQFDLSGAPVKGDPKAAVTIVEWADFQCPFCATSVPLIKQVMDTYPGKVKLVFKHMPLNMHPNAMPAAMASIEAQEQGKFWEMHDLLFQNYSQLTRENLGNFAKQIGLDMMAFDKAMQNSEHKGAIDKDLADSQRAGIRFSTPQFYINGKKLGNRDFNTFKKMIDEALAGGPQAAQAGSGK